MSVFGRYLLLFFAFLVGGLPALFVFPAAWFAPRVQHLAQNAVQLHSAQGTLARGSGLLVVPELGLRAPVRWQMPSGFGATIEMGGGRAQIKPAGAQVMMPITLSFSHPNVRATATVAEGATIARSPTGLIASGQISAPNVALNLPLAANLTNAKISLKPDGTWQLTAEGDLRVEGGGTLQSLTPPKGNAQIELTPSPSNAALESLVRRNVPADSAGRLRLNRNF